MNLEDNKILYADILQSLRLGGEILWEDDEGILVKDKISHILYSAATTYEAGKRIVQHLPDRFEILVAHDLYTDPPLQELGLHYEQTCYHCVYIGTEDVPVNLSSGYEIRRLDTSVMAIIIAMYSHSMESLANEEYIRKCLEDGMYGVWQNEELCGFIGVHDLASIGLLEIKEEHRRKGLAISLIQHMINEQLHKGRIPYGEIFTYNKASIKLQEKTSMEVGKDLTYWYFPKYS